jgi:amino acid permease
MPGAPPYPETPEHGPPPVGRQARRTRFVTALGATAIWAAVNLVLVIAVAGAPPSAGALGRFVGALIVPTLLATLALWAIARRRAWAFWLLVLVAAPLFWVLRAVFMALPTS